MAWTAQTSKLYIVTRRDLSPGAQAAQSCHAMREFAREHPDIEKSWYESSNHIAILSADSEGSLEQLMRKLTDRGIKFSLFKEPDLDNQLTAIAIEPGDPTRKVCSTFPLALKEYAN